MAAPTRKRYHVFISHAGSDKRGFADLLYRRLGQELGHVNINVFLDEHSLEPGTHAPRHMLQAAQEATVGVAVLSPEFVCRAWPMDELRVLAGKHDVEKLHSAKPNSEVQPEALLPVFLSLSPDAISSASKVEALYRSEEVLRLSKGQAPAADAAVLLEKVSGMVGVRLGQVDGFEWDLADKVIDAIIIRLKAAGALQQDFARNTQQHSSKMAECLLPYPRCLVGRQEHLDKMFSWLDKGEAVAITAPPGQGKSALAAAAAWKLWDAGKCTAGAFDVDLTGCTEGAVEGVVVSAITAALLDFKLISEAEGAAGLVGVLRWLRGLHDAQRAVIVLENTEALVTTQSVVMAQELHDVVERLQRAARGRLALVVTSRVRLAGALPFLQHFIGASELSFSAADAAAALRAYCGPGCQLSDQEVKVISKDVCCCNPLAINIVGKLLAERPAMAQEVMVAPMGDVGQHSRFITLEAKITHRLQGWLQLLPCDMLAALQALSVFGGSFNAGGAAALGLGTQDEAAKLLRQLEASALLQPLTTGSGSRHHGSGYSTSLQKQQQRKYSLHPLVRVAAHKLLSGQQAQRQKHEQQFVQYLVEIRGPDVLQAQGSPTTRHVREQQFLVEELPNVRQVVHLIQKENFATAWTLDFAICISDIASAALSGGQFDAAMRLLKTALDITERQLGPDHPDTATSLSNLASVLARQGKLEAAEAMHRRALGIREQQLGPDHPHTAAFLNNLAKVLADQGKLEAAEAMHRRAVGIIEQQLGPDHPHTAAFLNNLAIVLAHQGKLEAAEAMHRRALDITEQQLGPDHPDTATSLNYLASVLADQGKLEAAEAMHMRALGIIQLQLGPDHPDTATSLSNLASVLANQGKLEAAEAMHRRALGIREQQLGPDHPHTAVSLSNLASVLANQGKLEAAEAMHRRALGVREQQLGPDHPDTATSLSNLAGMLVNQGKLEAAEAMHRRALGIREQQLGPDHPDTATSLSNLASVLANQGKLEAAEAMHRRALGIIQLQLGLDYPSINTDTMKERSLVETQEVDHEGATAELTRANKLRLDEMGTEEGEEHANHEISNTDEDIDFAVCLFCYLAFVVGCLPTLMQVSWACLAISIFLQFSLLMLRVKWGIIGIGPKLSPLTVFVGLAVQPIMLSLVFERARHGSTTQAGFNLLVPLVWSFGSVSTSQWSWLRFWHIANFLSYLMWLCNATWWCCVFSLCTPLSSTLLLGVLQNRAAVFDHSRGIAITILAFIFCPSLVNAQPGSPIALEVENAQSFLYRTINTVVLFLHDPGNHPCWVRVVNWYLKLSLCLSVVFLFGVVVLHTDRRYGDSLLFQHEQKGCWVAYACICSLGVGFFMTVNSAALAFVATDSFGLIFISVLGWWAFPYCLLLIVKRLFKEYKTIEKRLISNKEQELGDPEGPMLFNIWKPLWMRLLGWFSIALTGWLLFAWPKVLVAYGSFLVALAWYAAFDTWWREIELIFRGKITKTDEVMRFFKGLLALFTAQVTRVKTQTGEFYHSIISARRMEESAV